MKHEKYKEKSEDKKQENFEKAKKYAKEKGVSLTEAYESLNLGDYQDLD